MRHNSATMRKAQDFVRPEHSRIAIAPEMSRLSELNESNRNEVLDFLAVRPVHTVVMTSFINDNGLENTLNRGKFLGYRSTTGTLEGVALIGHATLVEARSEEAIRTFAFAARSSETPINLIMSDGMAAESFWKHYSNDQPRLTCTEMLFEIGFPFLFQNCKHEIRPANMDEMLQVAEAQTEVAFTEIGRRSDAEGPHGIFEAGRP